LERIRNRKRARIEPVEDSETSSKKARGILPTGPLSEVADESYGTWTDSPALMLPSEPQTPYKDGPA